MRELQFIQQQLEQTAELVRRRYAQRGSLDISSKTEAADLLTAADLEVQRHVHRALTDAFPGDRLVAEEEGLSELPDDPAIRCWILDPIDGTHNFVKGLLPTFGVSLAFADRGEVVAGGVVFPILGKTYVAQRGGGATVNGQPVHVSDVSVLGAAKIEVDFSRRVYRDALLGAADAVLRSAGQIRTHGSAVAGLCAVASGDAEGYIAPGLSVWDFAASLLIVEEAGGSVSRLDGTAVQLFDGGKGLLASNGVLHGTLLSMLRVDTARG